MKNIGGMFVFLKKDDYDLIIGNESVTLRLYDTSDITTDDFISYIEIRADYYVLLPDGRLILLRYPFNSWIFIVDLVKILNDRVGEVTEEDKEYVEVVVRSKYKNATTSLMFLRENDIIAYVMEWTDEIDYIEASKVPIKINKFAITKFGVTKLWEKSFPVTCGWPRLYIEYIEDGVEIKLVEDDEEKCEIFGSEDTCYVECNSISIDKLKGKFNKII